MNPIATKVAVIGAGISGAVCASSLAKNGISVTIFESARGPGGRMSRRRETSEDERELYFDHGAPYFTSTNNDVEEMIRGWEARGLVAEWKQNFGSFDFNTKKFVNFEKEGLSKKYVGIPGMNSICRALCQEPGIESKFGVMVGRLEWLENEDSWSLTDVNGKDLGMFNGVVASDKSTFSQRFTQVTGKPPPLGKNACVDLTGVSPLICLGSGVFIVGQAALKAASCKVAEHEKTCMENQHTFIPFAFDTFGFLAPDAVELLNRVQQVMHSNVMTPRSMDVGFKRISFAIQKGVAV